MTAGRTQLEHTWFAAHPVPMRMLFCVVIANIGMATGATAQSAGPDSRISWEELIDDNTEIASESIEVEVEAPSNPVVTRVLMELGLGTTALLMPTVVGFWIGVGMCDSQCWGGPPILGALVGLSLGAALLPAAVTLAGSQNGGMGDAVGAYLGFFFGGAIYAGLVGAAYATNDDAGRVGVLVVGSLLPLVGSVVGYEVSDGAARARRITPHPTQTVRITSSGLGIGLAGTF